MPRKPPARRDNPEQSERFIGAAREAGASEDEAVFKENLRRLAKAKPGEKAKIPPSD